jgi:hypothetical protein
MTNSIDEQPMTPAEKVFDDFARVIMKQYSFVGFKRTYPTLLKAICAAIESEQPLPATPSKGVEERAVKWVRENGKPNFSLTGLSWEIQDTAALALYNAFIAGASSAAPVVGDDPDEFIEKHLAIIREKTKESLIEVHIARMGELEKASVKHFLETGKVSGSFYLRLKDMLEGFAGWKSKEETPSTLIADLEAANPHTGEINFSEDKRIGWDQCIAKAKELINKK